MNLIQSHAGSACYLSPRAYALELPTSPLVEARLILGWLIQNNGRSIPLFSAGTFRELDEMYFVAYPAFDNSVITSDGEVFASVAEWAKACLEVAEAV